jgi:hypothetical protein
MPRLPLTTTAAAHGNIRSDHAMMQRRQHELGGEVISGGLDDDRPSSPVEREDNALVVVVGRGLGLGAVLQHCLPHAQCFIFVHFWKLSRRGRR